MDKNKKCGYKLAPLPTTEATPPWPKAVPAISEAKWAYRSGCIKEEGKTPMRYNDNYASASVTTTALKSDAAEQRDYLLGRLNKLEWPKNQSFVKLFNLHIDNTPKTYKDLIDAIKNDKFTLNAKLTKKVDEFIDKDKDSDYPEDYNPYGAFFGIEFNGPKPDPDGYTEALKESEKQFTAAKDTIMSGVYADGLKALQDFEAWLPVGKSN